MMNTYISCSHFSYSFTLFLSLSLSCCTGIDLNLGCPQRHARTHHYGAYLLDVQDRPLLIQLLTTMSQCTHLPTSCKIRLLDDFASTQQLVNDIATTGVKFIVIHARTKGSVANRRADIPDLDTVRHLQCSIPLILNGGTRCAQDVIDNRNYTDTQGVMVGEYLLKNPTVFKQVKQIAFNEERVSTQQQHDESSISCQYTQCLSIVYEYINMVLHPTFAWSSPFQSSTDHNTQLIQHDEQTWSSPFLTFSNFQSHLYRMLSDYLYSMQLIDEFHDSFNVAQIRNIIQLLTSRIHNGYIFDDVLQSTIDAEKSTRQHQRDKCAQKRKSHESGIVMLNSAQRKKLRYNQRKGEERRKAAETQIQIQTTTSDSVDSHDLINHQTINISSSTPSFESLIIINPQ
jgi:tRNA-dihydrouridine synthase